MRTMSASVSPASPRIAAMLSKHSSACASTSAGTLSSGADAELARAEDQPGARPDLDAVAVAGERRADCRWVEWAGHETVVRGVGRTLRLAGR